MKISRFLQQWCTRDQRNPPWLPGFSFPPINPLEFHRDTVLNEEEYCILHILYCYSLQQHIFLTFCNDFDTHYGMFTYSSQKQINIVIPYSSVGNMEKGNFTNF